MTNSFFSWSKGNSPNDNETPPIPSSSLSTPLLSPPTAVEQTPLLQQQQQVPLSMEHGPPSYDSTPSEENCSCCSQEHRHTTTTTVESLSSPSESTRLLAKTFVDRNTLAPVVPNNHPLESSPTTTTTSRMIWHMYGYQKAQQHVSQLVWYMGVVLSYWGIVATLLIANHASQDFIESNYFLTFHMVEFWGAFGFALAEAILLYHNTQLLSYSSLLKGLTNDSVLPTQQQEEGAARGNSLPRSERLENGLAQSDAKWAALTPMDHHNSKKKTLWLSSLVSMDTLTLTLVSINVVTAAIAATLFTMDPELYEVPSHYIEYASQITVTLVDYLFILGGGRTQGPTSSWWQHGQVLLATLLLLMAIVKLFLYSGLIPTPSAEHSSHYVEFIGELVNSTWAFWFALQLYHRQQDQVHAHEEHLWNLQLPARPQEPPQPQGVAGVGNPVGPHTIV